MIRNLFSRIGCLMLFVGTIVLVVGVVGAQSGETPLPLYSVGAGMAITGFLLWARRRERPSRKKRFSLFRRRRRREAQKEENLWENQFYD